YWCYDRHRSVRLVVLVGLAIDQIAQSGLSSLSVIYYSAHLFRHPEVLITIVIQFAFKKQHLVIYLYLIPGRRCATGEKKGYCCAS
ncbi:hypothetical protein, partial [Enterobacter roggenkampii]|uniref:hypothetical protein n=1 Tax=Enterobacter roggenkampii TaxID=1812935 RepID=UPI0032B01724